MEKLPLEHHGSFNLEIDATGSEVGIKYDVAFQNEINKPSNLKFYYGEQELDEITDYEQYFTDIINADDTDKTRILTVRWEWAYETGNKDTTIAQNDKIDTDEGIAALNYMFDVIVTGTQVIPKAK